MIDTAGELAGRIIGPPGDFNSEWTNYNHKMVVPLPMSGGMSVDHAERLTRGARASGVFSVLLGRVSADYSQEPINTIQASETSRIISLGRSFAMPILLASSDLSGALLLTEDNYALLAGDDVFLSGAAPFVERDRVDFARYARKMKEKYPQIMSVSRHYPPHSYSWGSPHEVQAGSATARQISLIYKFLDGRISGSEFSDMWLSARRQATNNGERAHGKLSTVLDNVFVALDNYCADPEMWEAGDLTDADLKSAVRGFLNELSSS